MPRERIAQRLAERIVPQAFDGDHDGAFAGVRVGDARADRLPIPMSTVHALRTRTSVHSRKLIQSADGSACATLPPQGAPVAHRAIGDAGRDFVHRAFDRVRRGPILDLGVGDPGAGDHALAGRFDGPQRCH